MMASPRPKFTISVVGDTPDVTTAEQSVLLVGTMLASGSATAGQLLEDVQSVTEVETFVGKKSTLALAYRQFRRINTKSRVDILPLTEVTGAGTASASATLAFAGTASSAGTYEVQVVSKYFASPTITVPNGATAAAVATLVQAALAELLTDLPVTVSVSSGTVTITATQKGVELNDAFIAVYGTVPGLTVTVNPFAGGTGTVTVTDAHVAAMSPTTQYKHVVLTKEIDRTKFVTAMNARFNTENIVLMGTVLQSLERATASDVLTALNALNNPGEVLLVSKIQNLTNAKGVCIRELGSVAAAQFAASDTLALTSGEPISHLVPVNAGNQNDAFGGPALASLPYFNRKYPYLFPMPTSYGFNMEETDDIEDAGGTVWQNNRSGLGLTTASVVTTYKTDAIGNEDTSFKFLNYISTISEFKKLASNMFYTRFGSSRLGGSTIIPRRAMVNENIIKAFWEEVYRTAGQDEYCLTRLGKEELDFFKLNLAVSIDYARGLVSTSGRIIPVTQLREATAVFSLAFNIA